MNTANEDVTRLVARWLDDGDRSALAQACALAKATPVDVDTLLAWVRDHGAEPNAAELALRRLRFALGLPVVPGPVCRPAPSRYLS
ncbi:MAG: hypothetical protein NVS9B10_16520 [Nevskia sp.]